MTVENIGNIADVYSNGKLPQRGKRGEVMEELQKLVVLQCGSASIKVVIDWKHHMSWWEVCRGKQIEKCNNVCEAEYIYNKIREASDGK